MIPIVVRAEPKEDFQLEVQFQRPPGVKIVDIKPYLDKGVFRELRNVNYFRKVRVIFGGVEWPHKQDLSAETLYARGRTPTPPS